MFFCRIGLKKSDRLLTSILYILMHFSFIGNFILLPLRKRKQGCCFLLFELEETGSMPLPLLALACVLAVFAPEAGFGEKDLLIDPLENLADDGVKPLLS
jgi:hypothetical protein